MEASAAPGALKHGRACATAGVFPRRVQVGGRCTAAAASALASRRAARRLRSSPARPARPQCRSRSRARLARPGNAATGPFRARARPLRGGGNARRAHWNGRRRGRDAGRHFAAGRAGAVARAPRAQPCRAREIGHGNHTLRAAGAAEIARARGAQSRPAPAGARAGAPAVLERLLERFAASPARAQKRRGAGMQLASLSRAACGGAR